MLRIFLIGRKKTSVTAGTLNEIFLPYYSTQAPSMAPEIIKKLGY